MRKDSITQYALQCEVWLDIASASRNETDKMG